jgi:hypothetical protein
VLHIFSLLPVDCRLRCSEVCRDWRAALAERSLWTRLDVTAESGVRVREGANVNDLLRCAAARAGGGLQALHICEEHVTHEALLEVLAANAGALRELHTRDASNLGYTPTQAAALLAAAPLLHAFSTDLFNEDEDVPTTRAALRNEAPFGALRVRRLNVRFDVGDGDDADEDAEEASVLAFAADVAAHASLRELELESAPLFTLAALNAVVDAALTRRLQTVAFDSCDLLPASAPALARLLRSDALTTLECWGMDLLDAPAARVLAAALRANSTLTSLTLKGVGVFRDAAAGAELLGALTGHARLRVLNLGGNAMLAAHQAAVGAALGALVAANALSELEVSECNLGERGMRALVAALPANTHLRALDCGGNGIGRAFASDVLLPAVRANVSLRELSHDGSVYVAAAITRELRKRAQQW